MLKEIKSIYGSAFAEVVVYMLQSTEYSVANYLRWLWRVNSFSKVAYRRQLVRTRATKALVLALRLGIILNWLGIIFIIYLSVSRGNLLLVPLATVLSVAVPVIWSHLIIVPLLLGRWLLIPRRANRMSRAAASFKRHPALKIAIAGSYGKTSMKEILQTVLASGKKVAATSGNQNVPISHARFMETLDGDEDILIIEFGEGAPGDVTRFSQNIGPDMGIITGLAPAHLDKYKSLDAAADDIMSLASFLGGNEVYINGDSGLLAKHIKPEYHVYNSAGVLGWRVNDIKNDLKGLCFTMKKNEKTINAKTGLVGRHLIGNVALAASLADKLGIGINEIEKALSTLRPFEHRMQAYKLADAWIIDDTYNGNIEGIRAGLELLKEIPAKRKIYVTPGLVDQGGENERIHSEVGQLIAKANPDKVILMKNTVTKYIEAGLEKGNYKGSKIIETRPLEFYSNIDQLVAAGDLVLMQNDWPDNYN